MTEPGSESTSGPQPGAGGVSPRDSLDDSLAEAVGTNPQQLRSLTVPVLISAMANLLAGYLWFFFATCLGVFLTAPMLVLCAFEILYFVQAPRMSRLELTRRTTALGVFEILLGVFNGVSFVCGIVVLIQLRRLEQPSPAPPTTQ